LNALGGLFYVADTEFQQFNMARSKSKEKLSAASEPTEMADELNFDTLAAFLGANYPTRKQPDADDISKLVHQLKLAG
jgi:hypothetical protein